MSGAIADHALLLVGPTGADVTAPRPNLTPLSEAMRAGGQPPVIRQLGEIGGQPLNRGAVRRAVDAMPRDASGIRWCIIVGTFHARDREVTMVLDHDAPEDAQWPVREIAEISRRTSVAIAILDRSPGLALDDVVAALGDEGLRVAIPASDGGALAIDALVSGLRGAALDPRCGAVTASSLAAYLTAAGLGAVIARSADEVELFEPPSLERLWRLGRSILNARPLPALATGDDPELGVVLPGRFRLDARIAEGSFGIVFRARQLAIGRDVAVKVMRAGIDAFSEEGRLFVQEIQAVGRIDHANVVRVYQADVTAEGRLFFAMELIEGQDLQARLADGPMTVDAAIEVMRQALAGLEAAHRAGLVHADIKPGNVIVAGKDRAVLVDFGLARLRRADEELAPLGGTPAYMAPEQLEHGRIDARSDLFSAALVLVAITTGWRRKRAVELAPPASVLQQIPNARVRAVLERALAIDPADRFPSATAFAAALAGDTSTPAAFPDRPPFHGLASFSERDRGLLFGRDRELVQLSELALHRRVVVVTAPSGVGKTSLLRAGLRPRLEALAISVTYASCRTDAVSTLGPALEVETVILLDQVETALDPDEAVAASLLEAVLTMHRPDTSVVISVREDFLARLLERAGATLAGAPIVRIGPLTPAGARDAIVLPLAERRLTIAPDLLDRLLSDLIAAGRHLGIELGWGAHDPIYPPHLQLACAVLYDRLPAGAATLTLAHYLDLGGFDAIVGEHLDRVLDGLDARAAATARDLFLALVTAAHGRSARTEAELADALGDDAAHMAMVMERLRQEGLVVRVRRPDGDVVWELIHDSLVPRVLAWLDRRDLDRRRAVELVRYHLRRSRPGAPSLLSRAELRDLSEHREAIAAMDAEWSRAARTEGDRAWTPARLVTRSRQAQRRLAVLAAVLVATVIAGVGTAIFERWRSARERQAEIARRDRNLGLIAFEFAPFDWDVDRLKSIDVPIDALPNLSWAIHTVSVDPSTDVEDPGAPLSAERFRLLSSVARPGGTRLDTAEASGGPAFLVISGRNRAGEPDCGPSIIPIRSLPGYPQRNAGPQRHRVPVPTCQTTFADMIEIPAGEFIYGGPGDPPSQLMNDADGVAEEVVHMSAYGFARRETSNAQYSVLSSVTLAGVHPPDYFDSTGTTESGSHAMPVSFVDWASSLRFCRFLGATLPTDAQWEYALRGPRFVERAENRRTFAWKGRWKEGAARVRTTPPGISRSCSHSLDIAYFGNCDLVGNLQEWTASAAPIVQRQRVRITRGASWDTNTSDPQGSMADWIRIPNPRDIETRSYSIGFRCAIQQSIWPPS